MSTIGRRYAAARTRRRQLSELARRPEVLWLSAVFALAAGLRLAFALTVSRVQLVWDAASYWAQTQEIRATACYSLHYCDPGSADAGGTQHAVDTVLFTKNGLLPLLGAGLLSVLPNDVTTVLVAFAILDALVCVMVGVIVLRLGGPLWVGVLAAVGAAVYVPGIVGDGSFLQQPLIRFGMIVTVLAYVCAFTSERHRRAYVIAGTFALVLVAFSSQTTRPLLWAVAAAVIVIAWSQRSTHDIARMQLVASVAVGAVLIASMVLVSAVWPQYSLASAVSNIGLGLSTSGTATGQVTALSFPHFWPTDAWPFFADSNTTGSVFSDVTGAPLEFVSRMAYGTYANWRYPDLLYFQEFGLGRTGQILQHLLIVIPGFAGLAWLIGQAGGRRLAGAVVLVAIALISALAGLVSVEPRRVGALVPLLALGAACFVWSLAPRRTFGRFELLGGVALLACVVSWLVSVPALRSVFPLPPGVAYALLVIARAVATATVGAWLLADWRRRWGGFAVAPPAVLGGALLVLAMTSQLSGANWRPWTEAIDAPIQQKVDGLRLDRDLQPWLIADFGSPAQAAAAAIYVDGRLVKPAGERMRRWQVDGELVHWPPYEDLHRMGAEEDLHTWMATPLDRAVIAGGRATIEVRPPEGGLEIAGDYGEGRSYDGPALDPYFSGLSLWRWIWNGSDPRIPFDQDLGATYSAAGVDGRYRLYISQQLFGKRTNVLQSAAPTPVRASAISCPGGTRYATTAADAPGTPWLCLQTDGALAYHLADRTALGTTPEAALTRQAPRGTVVDRVRSAAGTVELISGGGPLLIANLRSSKGELLYSLGFSYPAVLPSYA